MARAAELTLAIDEKTGDYTRRPPGEVHGPFKTKEGCVVLETAYPGQNAKQKYSIKDRKVPPVFILSMS
jgi:hypothetical protein